MTKIVGSCKGKELVEVIHTLANLWDMGWDAGYQAGIEEQRYPLGY
jgi:hypothetical protein